MSRSSTGSLSRLGIGASSLLSIFLALVVVVLVNWLSGRPGLRTRFDLTSAGTNSLSPAATYVLDQLPDGIEADVFFRPEPNPYLGPILGQVAYLSTEVLNLMERAAEGRIEVRFHDVTDDTAWSDRVRELAVDKNVNGIVVSRVDPDTRERSAEVLQAIRSIPSAGVVVGDFATVVAGQQTPSGISPPRIRSFDAEAALTEALLAVTRGSRPKVVHTFGHGEADVFGSGPLDAGRLETLLREQGFVHERWNYAEDGALPEDTDVVSILAPQQPLLDEEIAAIRDFLEGGGRVVVVAHYDPTKVRASRIGELLEPFGIEVLDGIVCALRDPTGVPVVGNPRAGRILVPPEALGQHPIVHPYFLASRPLLISMAHGLRIVGQPENGVNQPVFRTSADTWSDGPPSDWFAQSQEPTGPFDVAVTSTFRPADAPVVGELEVQPEARLVVLGSGQMVMNQLLDSPQGRANEDLVRNVYNWVAERDWLVTVDTRDPGYVYVTGDEADLALAVARKWLPLLFVLLALIAWFVRSRGGPRRDLASEGPLAPPVDPT